MALRNRELHARIDDDVFIILFLEVGIPYLIMYFSVVFIIYFI